MEGGAECAYIFIQIRIDVNGIKVALTTQMLLYCFVYFAYLSLGVGSLKLASCTGMIVTN